MSKFPNILAVTALGSASAIALFAYAFQPAHKAEVQPERTAATTATRPAEAQPAPAPVAEAPAAVESAAAAPVPVAEPVAETVAAAASSLAMLGASETEATGSPTYDGPVTFALGRPALPEEIAAWDIDVRPDGLGLPEGRGDVFTGEEIFAENCAVCHGDFGEAVGRWPQLAGGHNTLTDDRPIKTIGSYWPYLSTVYDYVNRAMPFGNAQSLEPDQVYAITAYLLYVNDLVEDDFELSHENFAEVRLPNEENFFDDDRATGELVAFAAEPCMTDCRETVEISARAAVVDVTPEETAERAARAAHNAKLDADEAALAGTAAEAKAAEPAAEAAPTVPAETVVAALSADPALVAEGEKVFRKCGACHAVGEGAKNKSGPHLNAVIGRVAGGLDGFRYSNAMTDAGAGGMVWDAASLAAFLAAPKATIKGTKMSFPGLKSDADIAAVTAYLETFSE